MKVLNSLKLQKFEKANFAHFVSCSLVKKYSNTSFDKIDGLKTLEFEKANYANFARSQFDEKELKYIFWQKCVLLKVIKIEKANFAHFILPSW